MIAGSWWNFIRGDLGSRRFLSVPILSPAMFAASAVARQAAITRVEEKGSPLIELKWLVTSFFLKVSYLRHNLDDAPAALRIGMDPAGELQVFDGVLGGGSGDAAAHREL